MSTRAGLLILAVLFVAIVGAALLAGCAQLPQCERFTLQAVETDDGMVYVLDEENLVLLTALLHGMDTGKCRAWRGETV